MKFHTLLTHESPDLDSILSVHLMRRFGEERYEGVSTADIQFASANALPDGKTADELEQEGILCLDIGGGRFDTHPNSESDNKHKRDRSAADLVAEDLGVIYDENWAALVEYARLQDTTGHSLHSKDFVHHLTSLHTILLGLDILHKGNSLGKMEAGISIVENIPEFVARRDKQFNIKELLEPMVERYTFENPSSPDIPPRAYDNFNKWYQRLNLQPKDAFAKEPMDEMVSLKSIAIGAFYGYDKDREKVYEVVSTCLGAIFRREEQWALAVKDFNQNAVSKRLNKAFVTYIESENGMVIKAARYRNKGDIIIYRDPTNGATSILRRQQGPLNNFPLQELAAKVRIAEAAEAGTVPNFESLEQVGTHEGWFLHQSGNLLIKGSPKASNFDPSKISLPDLAQLACYQLGSDSIPAKYAAPYMDYQRHLLQAKFGR
ncbi:MAG: hypothetical protein AB8F95_04225 [Bacteroidia bacterium]